MRNKIVYDYLIELGKRERYISFYHFSDNFLDFQELINEDDLTKARARLYYYMDKLVKMGYYKKAKRAGCGLGALNEFGCKTLGVWEFINK